MNFVYFLFFFNRQAAKLVVLYDFRAGLYREEEAEEGEEEMGQGEGAGTQNEGI